MLCEERAPITGAPAEIVGIRRSPVRHLALVTGRAAAAAAAHGTNSLLAGVAGRRVQRSTVLFAGPRLLTLRESLRQRG
eukprot:9165493-Alexandrium_andersonii.AAC.1